MVSFWDITFGFYGKHCKHFVHCSYQEKSDLMSYVADCDVVAGELTTNEAIKI